MFIGEDFYFTNIFSCSFSMANVEEASSGGRNQRNIEHILNEMSQQLDRWEGMFKQSDFGVRSRHREDKHVRNTCHERRHGENVIGGRNREDCHLGSVKMKIPLFRGTYNSDVYLRWEEKVEKVFAYHDYSEKEKIRIASLAFSDHAVIWWDKLVRSRMRYKEDPIVTWDEMKRVMRRRFAPSQYKSHKSILEVSSYLEKVHDTNCVESPFVRETLDVISKEVKKPISSKEVCEERKEEDKRESELQNEREKERNIESSLEKDQKSEKNDERKEAKKEENKIDGPMESKNQSDEVKYFDEKERSLIFANTNNSLFSGDVSLMQEHGYVFPKEKFVDHTDFVF